MLLTVLKYAMSAALAVEIARHAWALHRRGQLWRILGSPRVMPWLVLGLISSLLGGRYARRIDLANAGGLPIETLEPSRNGLTITTAIFMVCLAITCWQGFRVNRGLTHPKDLAVRATGDA